MIRAIVQNESDENINESPDRPDISEFQDSINLKKFSIIYGSEDTGVCPSGRSGHRVIINENYLFVIGGYGSKDGNGCIFSEIWRLNLWTHSWSRMIIEDDDGQQFPQALASFAVCQVAPFSSTAIIHGGTALPFGAANSGDAFLVRLDSPDGIVECKPIEIKEQSRQLYGHALIRVTDEETGNVCFYAIGGTCGSHFFLNVDRLTFNMDGWEWISEINEQDHDGFYRLEGVHEKDSIILFGGGSTSYVKEFKELMCYDIPSQSYVTLETLPDESIEDGYPSARKCHSLVQWGRKVVIAGGCGNDRMDNVGRKVEIFPDVWVFDLDTLRWSKHPHNLSKPVFFHDAAVSQDGCMYIFGGVSDEYSRERSSVVQSFWLDPPSLVTLSCKVVHKNLRSMGVSPNVPIETPEDLVVASLHSGGVP